MNQEIAASKAEPKGGQPPQQVELDQQLTSVKPNPMGVFWTILDHPELLHELPKDVQAELERVIDPSH